MHARPQDSPRQREVGARQATARHSCRTAGVRCSRRPAGHTQQQRQHAHPQRAHQHLQGHAAGHSLAVHLTSCSWSPGAGSGTGSRSGGAGESCSQALTTDMMAGSSGTDGLLGVGALLMTVRSWMSSPEAAAAAAAVRGSEGGHAGDRATNTRHTRPRAWSDQRGCAHVVRSCTARQGPRPVQDSCRAPLCPPACPDRRCAHP
jgi:hypothetical protein